MDFESTIRSNWHELKGKVRQKWGKLTDQDTETLKGNYEEFSGKLEKAYGLTKDKIREEIQAMLGHVSTRSNSTKEEMKDKAGRAAEGVKTSLDNYNDDMKKHKIG